MATTELSDSFATSVSIDERIDYRVDQHAIKDVTEFLAKQLGVDGFEVSISFVTPETIHQCNKNFRNVDRATDVLSFPQEAWKSKPSVEKPHRPSKSLSSVPQPPKVLGDIMICPAIAAKAARSIGQSLSQEICFLIIHSLLHLCGYEHDSQVDEAAMISQQKQLLDRLKKHDFWKIWRDCVLETSKGD